MIKLVAFGVARLWGRRAGAADHRADLFRPALHLIARSVLIAFGALSLFSPGVAMAEDGEAIVQPPESYAYDVACEEQRVEMDDGVRIATTILRPTKFKSGGEVPPGTRFPIALYITAYEDRELCGQTYTEDPAPTDGTPADRRLPTRANFYTSRGFVVVWAEMRGTGDSEGNLKEGHFSARQGKDGASLVEHFADTTKNEFSNGKVVMYGSSAQAVIQTLTAVRRPRGLKAIAPWHSWADIYREAFTRGGAISTAVMPWVVAREGSCAAVNTRLIIFPTTDRFHRCADGYLIEHHDAADASDADGDPAGPTLAEMFVEILSHPNDDDFWRQRSPIHGAAEIEVPTLLVGGWRDGFSRGSVEMFKALKARGVETRLRMTPCGHLQGCTDIRPMPPDHEATDADYHNRAREFFYRHAMGGTTPDRSAVAYYVMPTVGYRYADDWPPPGTSLRRLPLRPPAETPEFLEGLTPCQPQGVHAAGQLIPGRTDSPLRQCYATNPAAGVSLTFGSAGTPALRPFAPLDQRLERASGLTWRTPRLTKPLTITGSLKLRLNATSTGTDTDWFAKVSDVCPAIREQNDECVPGSESIISEGALRASHRQLDEERTTEERPWHTHTDPTPIEPGKPYRYEFEIWPTAYELKAGHCLQLRLSSADMPWHIPGNLKVDRDNPGASYFEPLPPAVNTVHLGGQGPVSALFVPVFEGDEESLPTSGAGCD